MIEGRKQLRLFGLDCLECMYPNPIGSQGKTIQSQVNLDHPDLNKYPKFKETHCHYCILHPGNNFLKCLNISTVCPRRIRTHTKICFTLKNPQFLPNHLKLPCFLKIFHEIAQK